MQIRCAISPDADDRFMLRAIELGLIDTEGLDFVLSTADTQALNHSAEAGGLDVSAISIAWYPRLAAQWQLLPHGGSVGRDYGPVVVAPQPMALHALEGRRVAIPGRSTTAFTVLALQVQVDPVVVPIVPPQRVFEALDAGEVEAALLIHEGRLTYAQRGLHLVADMGQLWAARTGGLPLPLGGNVIRRGLGPETIAKVSRVLRASIAHGLAHRAEAIDWLLSIGSALPDAAAVDHYLSLYANDDTLDYGDDGRRAVEVLLAEGAAAGLLPACPPVDWAP